MVGRGTGDAVPLRAAGALIGPDGLAVRWTGIGCACGAASDPTAFWGGHRRRAQCFGRRQRRPVSLACVVRAPLMPAAERLRRARHPQAAFPPLCVRNRGEHVRNFQFMAGPLAQRQAALGAVSQRRWVLHTPARGLGRAPWSPRPPHVTLGRRNRLAPIARHWVS